MQPTSRTSSKPGNGLSASNEPTMLLEVTPSLLHALGIGQGSVVRHGSASYEAPGQGTGRRARMLQVIRLKTQRGAAAEAPAPRVAAEPQALTLSAQAMAERMQCTRNNVYDQESRGRLFSVIPPGRRNGRAFPAFQLDPALDRTLVRELIGLYAERKVPMNLLWDFLRTAQDAFGGLTGVQVLTRKTGGTQVGAARAEAILGLPDAQRREMVVDAALENLSHAFL